MKSIPEPSIGGAIVQKKLLKQSRNELTEVELYKNLHYWNVLTLGFMTVIFPRIQLVSRLCKPGLFESDKNVHAFMV